MRAGLKRGASPWVGPVSEGVGPAGGGRGLRESGRRRPSPRFPPPSGCVSAGAAAGPSEGSAGEALRGAGRREPLPFSTGWPAASPQQETGTTAALVAGFSVMLRDEG